MPKYRIDGQIYDAENAAQAYEQYGAAKRGPPGIVSGSLASFGQGLSLGSADELQAGLEAATGGDYSASLERQKLDRQAFSREHPIASGVATAAGAVAPVVMATLAGSAGGPPGTVAGAAASSGRAFQLTRQALGLEGAQAVGRANTVGQAFKEGARASITPGAIAGYATADPGERGIGAAAGGAAGAVLGGGIAGAWQMAQNMSGRATPYLQQVAERLGVNPSGMVSRAAPSGGGGNVTPITRDEAMILQRMEEGGVAPETAAAALDQARRAGVPLTLLDVGGQPLMRYGRGVRSLPGEASATIDNALAQRAATQPQRVTGWLERGVGRAATGNGGAVADDLLRKARADAAPLYAKLDALPPIKDQAVADVFRIPAVQQIVQRSEANAAKFGETIAPLYDEAGNLLREPTFADVNRVKQSLDDLLSPTYNAGPRPADSPGLASREEQALARRVRAQLVTSADKAPGGAEYKAARESFAGPARAREQYNEGLDFTRKNTSLEDVRAQRAAGSPMDRKWYDRGAMEGLRAKIASVDDLGSQPNTLRQFWGSPEARAKVDAIIPASRRGKLNQRLTMENQAAQTNAFVRSGSQTADKTAEALDVAADMVSATPGGPKAIVAAAAQKAWERVRLNANEATRGRIARHLVNMDPAQQQAFLTRLADLQQRGQVNAQQIATVASVVTKQRQASNQ